MIPKGPWGKGPFPSPGILRACHALQLYYNARKQANPWEANDDNGTHEPPLHLAYHGRGHAHLRTLLHLIPVAFIPLFAFLADLSWDLLFGASAVIVALIFACSMATIYFGKRIARTGE